jgi:glycine dehydrogenase
VKRIATRIHALASAFAAAVSVSDGLEVVHPAFFDTVLVECGNGKAGDIYQRALDAGFNLRRVGETVGSLAIAFHEESPR